MRVFSHINVMLCLCHCQACENWPDAIIHIDRYWIDFITSLNVRFYCCMESFMENWFIRSQIMACKSVIRFWTSSILGPSKWSCIQKSIRNKFFSENFIHNSEIGLSAHFTGGHSKKKAFKECCGRDSVHFSVSPNIDPLFSSKPWMKSPHQFERSTDKSVSLSLISGLIKSNKGRFNSNNYAHKSFVAETTSVRSSYHQSDRVHTSN